MKNCDFYLPVGQAIKLARQDPYLSTLGDMLCRPEDHTHIQYGIPSYLCGMVYAMTLCGVLPSDITWYPMAADEGFASNVPETDYMAVLARRYAFLASIGAQNTLNFDTAPTEGSENPVTSGGVDNAIGDLALRYRQLEERVTALELGPQKT